MPRSLSVRPRAGRVFLSVAAVVLAVAGLSAAAVRAYARATASAEHAMTVRQRALEWLNVLVDAETGVRGAVAADDRSFLEPYQLAVAREPKSAAAVRGLLSGKVPEGLLDAAQHDARRTMDHLGAMASRVEAGRRDEALAILTTGVGRHLMDAFRHDVDGLTSDEATAVLAAQEKARAWARTALVGSLVLTFLACGLLALAWRRERSRRERVITLAKEARGRLKALSDLTAALVAARTRTEVARVIVEQCLRATGANTCTLYELEASGAALDLLAGHGVAPEVLDKVRRITEANDAADVLANMKAGTSVWAEDDADYARLYPKLAATPAGNQRARAFWSVPLVADGWSLGLLGVGYYEPRAFSPDERRFVETLCRHCAEAFLRASRLEHEDEARRWLSATLREAEEGRVREQALRGEAELANRAKDEFLATVSHELRTPLTSILGWATLLRRRKPPAELDRGLATIERNARLQTKLIEDVLDISRIISGKLALNIGPAKLGDVIWAAVETVTPAASLKGIVIATELTAADLTISGDADRLQQVVWNLLANAVKFTPKGGRVVVRAGRDGSNVWLRVEDSGEGIRADVLPVLFEPFRQADASTTRRHGGLGLGLAIVKQLVLAHGGTVEAESRGEGHGATFTVRLPAGAPHRPGHRRRGACGDGQGSSRRRAEGRRSRGSTAFASSSSTTSRTRSTSSARCWGSKAPRCTRPRPRSRPCTISPSYAPTSS